MGGLSLASEKLGITKAQLKSLMHHWYLAGFLDEERLDYALKNYFELDAKEVQQIVTTVNSCIKAVKNKPIEQRKFGDFDADRAWDTLFRQDEEAGLALAFINFIQQNHFTKLNRKEVSASKKTIYTQTFQTEIKKLAKQFGMLDANPLNEHVDVALVIGGRAATNILYLANLKKAINQGLIKHSFILLSDRLLIDDKKPDNSDNLPCNAKTCLPFEHDDETYTYYQDYLKAKYPHQALTEGLSMRDSFKHLFGFDIDSPEANTKGFHPIMGTMHSAAFDKKALEIAVRSGYLTKSGKVSAFRIQPYLVNFKKQLENIAAESELLQDLNLTISANGPRGNDSGHILMQALAMVINTSYDRAAQAILQIDKTIKILPKEKLQLGTRDKKTSQESAMTNNVVAETSSAANLR